MKERTLEGFGSRLTQLRKARGLTQLELGQKLGVSNRVIAYYEADGAQPPGALLIEIARVLRVSTDELLGCKPVKEPTSPKTARLLKRLRKIEKLPLSDQRAIFKFVDALCSNRGISSKSA